MVLKSNKNTFLPLILVPLVNSTFVLNQTDAVLDLSVSIEIPRNEITFCVNLRFGENIDGMRIWR